MFTWIDGKRALLIFSLVGIVIIDIIKHNFDIKKTIVLGMIAIVYFGVYVKITGKGRRRLFAEQHHHHRCGRLLQYGHLSARQHRIQCFRHLVFENEGTAGRIFAAEETLLQDQGVPERLAVVLCHEPVLHHEFPAVRSGGGFAFGIVALPRRRDGRLPDDPFLRIQSQTRILKLTRL